MQFSERRFIDQEEVHNRMKTSISTYEISMGIIIIISDQKVDAHASRIIYTSAADPIRSKLLQYGRFAKRDTECS